MPAPLTALTLYALYCPRTHTHTHSVPPTPPTKQQQFLAATQSLELWEFNQQTWDSEVPKRPQAASKTPEESSPATAGSAFLGKFQNWLFTCAQKLYKNTTLSDPHNSKK